MMRVSERCVSIPPDMEVTKAGPRTGPAFADTWQCRAPGARSDRTLCYAVLSGDPAQFAKFGDAPCCRPIAPRSRMWPRQWHPRRVVGGRPVDQAGAGPDAFGNMQRAPHVAVEHRRGQADIAFVGTAHRFIDQGRVDDGQSFPCPTDPSEGRGQRRSASHPRHRRRSGGRPICIIF